MEKREKEGWPMEGAVQVIWEREDRTLALEGEPVLEYALSWPRIEGGGLGGAWISRYYARLAGCWRQRWEREAYWKACVELAVRRRDARPFTPWRGERRGVVGGASTGRTGELGVDREGWRGVPCSHSPRWEARSTGAVGARAAAELRVAPRPAVPAARSRAGPTGQELPASSRAGPLETKHPTPSHVPSHVKAKFRPL